jgi:hypothetical protein
MHSFETAGTKNRVQVSAFSDLPAFLVSFGISLTSEALQLLLVPVFFI